MGTVSPIAVARRVSDGLVNLMSKLGTGADRNSQNRYFVQPLTQPEIEAAYRTSWLTRKVHDLVPFEMTRAGRDWQASKEQIERLEQVEGALCLWAKLAEALRTARLHGGAAIVLGVRQGLPDTPLVVDRLGKDTLRYAVVVSRHQLHAPDGMDADPESDFFGQPAMWEMRGAKNSRVRVHPSRIICFHGAPLPPGAVATSWLDTFWGDPLLTSIKSAIDNAEVSQAAVSTLLHEMKLDTISIPDLTETIARDDAEKLLAARIEAIGRFRSMFNVTLLDGGSTDGAGKQIGGEKWETRQLSFAQMPELLRQFVAIVAGAADIPVTRLMGESPGGMQSTGKGEQDDFNRMIGARQASDLRPALMRLDEILIRSALGIRPPEITSVFAPLEEPDAKDAAEVEKTEAETVEIYSRTALIPSDALAKAAANRLIESGRWPGLDKAIDESNREIGEPDEDADALPALPPAANDDEVDALQRRGAVTRDQALVLLADSSPRSLYISRRLLNAAEVIAWAKGEGFETTLPADDLHSTVIFSRAPVDWMKAGGDYWGGDDNGHVTVAPGGPRLVERFGEAVVLLFYSGAFTYRHESLKREGASHDYEYQPHVTLTWRAPPNLDLSKVTPFRGKLEFGPEIFEEVNEGWKETIREV